MASNQNQGFQSKANPDWRKYLQLLVDRLEEFEAEQTAHPVISAKEIAQWIIGCIETIDASHQKPHVKFSKADRLNDVIAKLSSINDFIKRIGDDNFILEPSTPFGLHLIMNECIEELEEIGGLNE